MTPLSTQPVTAAVLSPSVHRRQAGWLFPNLTRTPLGNTPDPSSLPAVTASCNSTLAASGMLSLHMTSYPALWLGRSLPRPMPATALHFWDIPEAAACLHREWAPLTVTAGRNPRGANRQSVSAPGSRLQP